MRAEQRLVFGIGDGDTVGGGDIYIEGAGQYIGTVLCTVPEVLVHAGHRIIASYSISSYRSKREAGGEGRGDEVDRVMAKHSVSQ
jgi:hypothetical protein